MLRHVVHIMLRIKAKIDWNMQIFGTQKPLITASVMLLEFPIQVSSLTASWGHQVIIKETEGTWLPLTNNADQWLQIDLLENNIIVTRIATQGLNNPNMAKWVTSYNLQYSNDEINFHYYIEQGETVKKVY